MNPKTVLITGANRGIGLEFVKQLLRLHEPPTHIFAACRSPDKAQDLNELAKKTSALKVVKLDIGNLETIEPLKQEIERIVGNNGLNLLINNAGMMSQDGLTKVTAENMRETYNVNVVGPMMISQAFSPLLTKAAHSVKESGMSSSKAAIVNISSGTGSIGEASFNGLYSYRCSKAAMNMLTKILSIDLRKDGVLVVSFCPGWVQTGMGGPNAKLTTEQSIEGILNVMSQLTEKDTGTFRSTNGRAIPW